MCWSIYHVYMQYYLYVQPNACEYDYIMYMYVHDRLKTQTTRATCSAILSLCTAQCL